MKAIQLILIIYFLASSLAIAAKGDHYGAEFRSLDECLSATKKFSGYKLRVVTDKPDLVAGVTKNSMWSCTKVESGIKGIYWESSYTER